MFTVVDDQFEFNFSRTLVYVVGASGVNRADQIRYAAIEVKRDD